MVLRKLRFNVSDGRGIASASGFEEHLLVANCTYVSFEHGLGGYSHYLKLVRKSIVRVISGPLALILRNTRYCAGLVFKIVLLARNIWFYLFISR